MSCSGGDHPLGGPFGGVTPLTPPTPENSQALESGAPGPLQAEDGGSSTTGVDASNASSEGSVEVNGPTWTYIFNQYMQTCQTCHNQMMSAPKAYTWLKGQGYIAGANSPLVSSAESCLSWYGGNMPPDGTSNPQAVTDMNAWARAGAPND